MKQSHWCNSPTRDGHLHSHQKTASYWRPEGKYSVLALCSWFEQAAIRRSARSLNFSDLKLLLSLLIMHLNCGITVYCKGHDLQVEANKQTSDVPRPLAICRILFFFFLSVPQQPRCPHISAGTPLKWGRNKKYLYKLSSQACRRQSRPPLLLLKLCECLSRLTFCSASSVQNQIPLNPLNWS